jgi:hypothetical protein
MISKLPMIEPGWSVTPEHVNATRAKVNEVIDVLNVGKQPWPECPMCHGAGIYGYPTPETCPRCAGIGCVDD